ncbi:MAG: hypothetical protein ACM3UN_04300 [Bacillota bacterium]
MVIDGAVLGLWWGFVKLFFSMPHLPSVLFTVVGVLTFFVGIIGLIRRV